MFLIVSSLVELALALAILWPGAAASRSARFRRTIAAASGFCAAHVLGMLLGAAMGRTGGRPDYLALSLIGSLLLFCLTLIPFALAERAAAWFAPRRSIGWATAATAMGFVWALWTAVQFSPAGRMDGLRFVFELALPALLAGLAWTALLPRPSQPVATVFE